MMRFGIMSGGPRPYPGAIARNKAARNASARAPIPVSGPIGILYRAMR